MKPIKIRIPGSKSYTNRALFIAAMNQSAVKIINYLISDDTKAMISCLRSLGVNIIEEKNYIRVSSDIRNIPSREYDLDADLSGTTLRFLLALSTVINGTKILYGLEGLNNRPVADLVLGLKQLGAKIEYVEKEGYPPVEVLSSKLNSGTVKINGSVSSQYISAILMVAPLIGGISIEIIGDQISKPYIDMTIDIMKKFGVEVENKNYKKYIISPNPGDNILFHS